MCGGVEGAEEEGAKEAYRYLDPKRSRYKNRKIKLFSKLAHEEPENAFLAPMRSEMPTVTAIRVKSLMTGALNSYIEVMDNFGGSAVQEDNIFKQLKARPSIMNGIPLNSDVSFCGGFTWMALYGKEFTRAYPHELFNVADLDDCDDITMRDINKEMTYNNFTMLIAHIIGIDHAGHYYLNVAHPDMERKILDAEAMIKKVIK